MRVTTDLFLAASHGRCLSCWLPWKWKTCSWWWLAMPLSPCWLHRSHLHSPQTWPQSTSRCSQTHPSPSLVARIHLNMFLTPGMAGFFTGLTDPHWRRDPSCRLPASLPCLPSSHAGPPVKWSRERHSHTHFQTLGTFLVRMNDSALSLDVSPSAYSDF